MTDYHNFIGIDIGKFNFVVATYGQQNVREYENNAEGIIKFLNEERDVLRCSLCILETTGGYELELLYSLCAQEIAAHRADARKVKNFIRSFGNSAKTDKLDSKSLAKYGAERFSSLEIFKPQSKQSISLFQLVQRRADLKQMLVAEKNRMKGPSSEIIKGSCEEFITFLSEKLESITKKIKETVELDEELKRKQEVLKTIPGVGEIVSFELLILLPELGKLTRRQIASLAGVAPKAHDSGKFQGHRRTGHGRLGIKPILFLAAMAGRNSKSSLKDFYESLISKGKKKMVALTALMRKIIVMANAKIRDLSSGKADLAVASA